MTSSGDTEYDGGGKAPDCGVFPDIFEPFVAPTNLPEKTVADLRHKWEIEVYEPRRFLYRCLAEVLVSEFGFTANKPGRQLPPKPDDFATADIDEEDRIEFVAIYGLMLLNNFTDPEFGRSTPSSDDKVIDEWDLKRQRKRFIARRFIDAVVDAVQEYTARKKLFERVYGFLKHEQQQGQAAPAGA